MSYSTRNHDQSWTAVDDRQLRDLALRNTRTRVIGFKLGRTEAAVRARAHELGVSLKSVNQSPYNRG